MDVADLGSVSALANQAEKDVGAVDIVINNAGILRDVSFQKMEDKDWVSAGYDIGIESIPSNLNSIPSLQDLVWQVHVNGAYKVTRAAWPYMRENKYGRIVMITSSAGP